MERRRDKVIEDDNEFKEYLAVQDAIADDFCRVLGLPAVNLAERIPAWSFQDGFPGPQELFNCTIDYITGTLNRTRCTDSIEYLRLSSNIKLSMLYQDPIQPGYKAPRGELQLKHQRTKPRVIEIPEVRGKCFGLICHER